MAPVVVLLAISLGLASGIDDFKVDDTRHHYEFIYHDRFDLLLTIHGDNCYYAYIADSREIETRYLIEHTINTERHIEHLITFNDPSVVASTLDAVRNKFHDILADFHCTSSNIFTIALDLNQVNIG